MARTARRCRSAMKAHRGWLASPKRVSTTWRIPLGRSDQYYTDAIGYRAHTNRVHKPSSLRGGNSCVCFVVGRRASLVVRRRCNLILKPRRSSRHGRLVRSTDRHSHFIRNHNFCLRTACYLFVIFKVSSARSTSLAIHSHEGSFHGSPRSRRSVLINHRGSRSDAADDGRSPSHPNTSEARRSIANTRL